MSQPSWLPFIMQKQVTLTHALSGEVIKKKTVWHGLTTFRSVMVGDSLCVPEPARDICLVIEMKDQDYKRIVVSPTYDSNTPTVIGDELHVSMRDQLSSHCQLWDQIDTNPEFCIQCINMH